MNTVATKKNIIITGATSGIGRTLAQTLDCEANHLILLGRSHEKLKELAGRLKRPSSALPVDLTDLDQLSALREHFPSRIHGFVHAAGVESVEPLKLITYKKFDYIMRLHLYSFMEILKAIDREKKKDDEYDTSVVAISSIASDSGGVGQTMYSASKAALEATVRILSKEMAPKRIRINAVRPGIVDTEMTARWMKRIGIDNIAEIERMHLNGVAKPDDVANLVAFLLSEKSRHIVGAHITIDGGGPSGKVF